MPLTPDKKEIINGLTVYEYDLSKHNPNKIDMPTAKRKKTVAITIHNTEWINVASNTTPAEQYVRATQNGAMKSVRVHYYVDNVCAWHCLSNDLINWSCADGTANANSGNNTSIAIEVIGSSAEAEANAVKLAAWLLKEYGLTVAVGLRTHTYWLNVKDGVKGDIDTLNTKKHPYKWCLPLDTTELLTPSGWVSLADVKKGQKIAQYNKGEITFVECQDVVEPYEAEVLKSRFLEATANHRMYGAKYSNLSNYEDVLWEDMLSSKNAYRIPTSGELKVETPLPLTDEQLLLLAWIQGDGHYMKDKNQNVMGIEFHLKKTRKIERIRTILEEMDIAYVENWCKNGTVHLRIYDKELYLWAEQWLSDKKFTFKMLDMSKEQFELFINELYIIDGHKNERQKLYTSSQIENLDFVQALCAAHGTRSSLCTLGSSKKYFGEQPVCLNVLNTNASFCKNDRITKRNTLVSCVSVPSSYILIRQNNHVFVVGNCPAYILPHWSDFKKNVEAELLKLKSPKEQDAKPEEKKNLFRVRKSWDNPKSQIGAFANLDGAKKACLEGYYVFDWNGNVVYPIEEGVDIFYQSYSCKKWLGKIKNYNDVDGNGYSGIKGKLINGLAVQASKGTVHYRVHIKGGGWLSWITKFDPSDWNTGCAGFKSQIIDGVQVFLEGVEGYEVKYRVSAQNKDYYPWVIGCQDYAGVIGRPIDRIQMQIVKI